ncbi:MAG: indole-3-glycerol phosphate synthase TrpC [Gemmatimonadaceae bacterium]
MPETQAQTSWRAPTGTLGELVASATRRAATLAADEREWRGRAEAAGPRPSLCDALRRETVTVIAEVKRWSPSKGVINGSLDASEQARRYAAGGAAAISVLTEPERFGGSSEDLAAATAAVAIPVLKKDFHVAPVQLYEARALGASAALLIVRALEPERLRHLLDVASYIGLESLVEVRDAEELELALAAGAALIGVNNRDLESLVIDPSTVCRIIPLIPVSVVAVAESGMSSKADIEGAAACGADAVLVGSAISAAEDPSMAVSHLVSVRAARSGRLRHPDSAEVDLVDAGSA